MNTKKWIATLAAVLLLVSIAGCAAGKTAPGAEGTQASQPPAAAPTLTEEEAQALALEHGGFTADQVTDLRIRYEVDDGVPEYEIEFRQGDDEYDCTVHAETGVVLEWEKDHDPLQTPPADKTESTTPTKPVESESGTTAPTKPTEPEPTPERLTKDEAAALALDHAGLSADQVTGLRTEYDVDDGVPEYDIEFRLGDYEYDYTIHAETGAVLDWDKEYDPPETRPTNTETTAPEKPVEPAPEELTKAEAEAIALDHAGLIAEQVTGLETEYDVDDGVPEYTVEFRADGWEYEYQIHAETGQILNWERDD